MLYGSRVKVEKIQVVRDLDARALEAKVEIEMINPRGFKYPGFVFPSFDPEPLENGKLYTLDSDPNDYYGYWGSLVTGKLSEPGRSWQR